MMAAEVPADGPARLGAAQLPRASGYLRGTARRRGYGLLASRFVTPGECGPAGCRRGARRAMVGTRPGRA